ncbi:sigma 54-interacting transcriptional regulator [Sorangium sp. So ce117]|uniref:sigma 54-interacting transcriptional regulator n=1 Tax=Sorangium sp. So ce117 TaxID=3133277 RepID=UPI003F5D7EC0
MAGIRETDIGPETTPLSSSFIDAIQGVRQDDRRVALLVYHRDGAERAVLSPGVPVVIGRAPPSQVQIGDVSLSREHARFTQSGDKVVIEDLRSTNGTWLGGERITRGEVKPGEEVILGKVVVAVRSITAAEDELPGLMSHEQLRVALEEEVKRARYFGRSFAVVMARVARQPSAHVSHLFPRVRALLRPVDRIALYSSDVVAALLLEAGAEVALDVARALAAPPGGGSPVVLAGFATFPDAGTVVEELLDRCWSAVRSATVEQPVRSAPGGTWKSSPGACNFEPVVVSSAMRRVFEIVKRVSRSSIPVLLLGETGTGKEVVARAIHDSGPRSGKPMVCVNCGAIPQQLVESTLFGHERGSFTGAWQQQRGVFEAADGGTVFLDEIGELPAAVQAALLRVLETRQVTRVGSNKPIDVDARVVAATHRDVEAMCASGAFRSDLFYRLNTMTMTIPPLRARPEDIEPLALRFLDQANQANGRSIRGFDAESLARLRAYSWPGNARELRNAIERAVVIAEGEWIAEEDLPERARAAPSSEPAAEAEKELPYQVGELTAAPPGGDYLKTRLQRCEAELIVEALRKASGNQTEAARALGMPLRTLVYKLKAHGIKRLGYAPPREP